MKKKQSDPKPKIKYVKNVEIRTKMGVADILSYLHHEEVTLQQVLLQYGNYLMFDGISALSGLPIVTNERSCTCLESGLICKYILENWDEVSKMAIEHYKKSQKDKKEVKD